MVYRSSRREHGDRVSSRDGKNWVCVGAPGVVLRVTKGTPAVRCPDHTPDYSDCSCQNESGFILPGEPWATVRFDLTPEGTQELAMKPSREHDAFVWACFYCGEPRTRDPKTREDVRRFTWNAGRPAHVECALKNSKPKKTKQRGTKP